MAMTTMPNRGGQPGGKGGYGGPNTSGPGGQGRDYNGNAIGSNMPGEFTMGGPRMIGGGYGQPIFGGRPNPGDLYQPGGMPPQGNGRFQPRGMIPPAGGRIGNPRQLNPGQGPMQPGQPQQPPSYGGGKGGFQGPMTMESPRGPNGRYLGDEMANFEGTGNNVY